MNRIDELIKKLCPNGVEYKKASEIKIESFWLMPSTPTYIAEGVPYITSKNIKNGKINFENVNYISEKDYLSISSNRTIKKNDLLITMIGTIGETAFVEEDIKFYGQNMYLIRLNEKVINRKFFNYYLTSEKIKNSLVSRKNTSSQGYIKAGSIENLLIPVPPLEVQCEIVHILDDFTLLSAELSAELKARQQQYEYYKNELYSFKDKDVKYVKLKEIAEIYRGGNFQKKDFIENGKPCIHYGQIYTKYGKTANKTYTFVNDTVFEKSKQAGKNDIVMAVTSENIEDVCKCVVWLGNENIAVSGHTAIIHTKINARYLGYYFSTLHFFIDKAKLAHGTKVIEVTPSSLNDILIPVPSEEEQENIASEVEKFEKLCNDISEGLPAEIEARQKQYEYYRDKLLTFKELKVNE